MLVVFQFDFLPLSLQECVPLSQMTQTLQYPFFASCCGVVIQGNKDSVTHNISKKKVKLSRYKQRRRMGGEEV
jgi:hypothetical protein